MSMESIEITKKNFWDIYNMFENIKEAEPVCYNYPLVVEYLGYNKKNANYYVYFEQDVGILYNLDNQETKWYIHDDDDDDSELIFDDFYEAQKALGKQSDDRRISRVNEDIKKKKEELAELENMKKELLSCP
tara:strand:- start:42 stop:437 length:396 start_codon:yes stop_codon:yes gene_type:complete